MGEKLSVATTLRVATLNIWNRFGDWPQRLPVIRQRLAELAPDLLALQEVIFEQPLDESHDVSTSQAHEIAAGFGYHVVCSPALVLGADDRVRHVLGNALLSRHPILDASTMALPQGPDSSERRSLLCATVATPGLPMGVYVTHLNWKLDESSTRIRQVRAIVDAIMKREPGDGSRLPALLLGDFNAEPESSEMRYLTGLAPIEGESTYFADAWRYLRDASGRPLPGWTFDPSNPNTGPTREFARRIDYILIHGGPDEEARGLPVSVRLCFDEPTEAPEGPIFPSDHYGVSADLKLN